MRSTLSLLKRNRAAKPLPEKRELCHISSTKGNCFEILDMLLDKGWYHLDVQEKLACNAKGTCLNFEVITCVHFNTESHFKNYVGNMMVYIVRCQKRHVLDSKHAIICLLMSLTDPR